MANPGTLLRIIPIRNRPFNRGVASAPEFNGRSEATQIVAEMLVLDTKPFFDGRLNVLQQLVSRFRSDPPPDMPDGYLQNAELALRDASKAASSGNTFKDYSRDIYHADIQLRQFANPYARFSALVFLGCGVILMIVPTGLNVFRTLLYFFY